MRYPVTLSHGGASPRGRKYFSYKISLTLKKFEAANAIRFTFFMRYNDDFQEFCDDLDAHVLGNKKTF